MHGRIYMWERENKKGEERGVDPQGENTSFDWMQPGLDNTGAVTRSSDRLH